MIVYEILQFSLTQSQRDLYSSHHEKERNDHGRVNLNLYGNKFYNPKERQYRDFFVSRILSLAKKVDATRKL